MKPWTVAIASCFLATSAVARAAPTLVLDDPLTQPLGSGQNVNGGSFSASGWTRDSFSSQIVYNLGRSITAGRMIFEMDGVNGVDQGVGGFPDCRSIFAAVDNNDSGDIDGSGNPGVQFLWAWAMEETDYCNGGPGGLARTDRMKLLVHTDAASEPGEPMSDPLTWDITQFYTYEIGWNADHAWLLRDGQSVLDQPYPSAPVVMNMRYVFLGTVNRYQAGVKNATYRNLKVWDDQGPAPTTDAGTSSDASTDSGSSCLSAGPLTPQNGSGASGVLQVVYSNCEGASAFRVVQIWVGDQVQAGVPAVSAGYEAGQLGLAGTSDTCAPGDAKVLQSTYGSLDCATSSVSASGNDMIVRWSLAFDTASFLGTHKVFVDAKGGSGTPEPRLGWTALGSFDVTMPGAGPDGGAADSGGTPPNESTSVTDRGSGCGCRLSASEPTRRFPLALALLLVGCAVGSRRRIR